MIGERISHFRILEHLASGGMGEVFAAEDLRLGRRVALKFLSAEFVRDESALRRFHDEARAVAELSDPHVAVLYDFETDTAHPFLVLEYLEGRTLRDHITEGPLPVGEVVPIAKRIARGLAAAHARGIVHCDVKPSNVMLTEDGRVKILDFGLARVRRRQLEVDVDADHDTTRREPLASPPGGTLSYLAPELLQGAEPSARSDVYAWGVVVYEMVAGEPPFRGRTMADLVGRILRDAPPPMTARAPGVPRTLVALVERCLAKDPERRPVDALELVEELDREAAAATPSTPRSSVAVLPFTDMSPQRDQAYFCEGIAEDLTFALSTISGLRVASRTSAFRFHRSDLDSRQIGRALGVDLLVQGSVRRVGDHLRITAQLIDVEGDHHLWSERYDREMSDVLEVQDEIAHAVAEALQFTIRGEDLARRMPPTRDVEAYELFLRGRKLYSEFRRRSVETALGLFRLALRRDPHYALAHAGVANCCCYLFLYAERRTASLRDAEAASARALELSPELSEVQAARGQVLSLAGRHAEARECFERALDLGPYLFEAHYLYARDSFAQGHLEQAAAQFEEASRVCPSDYQSLLLVAQIYESLGRSEEARAAREKGVRVAEARIKSEPGDVRALYMGANGLAALGDRDRAFDWVRLARSMEPDDPMVLYNVACVLSLLGNLEEAIDVLERAVGAGLGQKGWILHDSNLDPLRSLPRYADLLAAVERLEARTEET